VPTPEHHTREQVSGSNASHRSSYSIESINGWEISVPQHESPASVNVPLPSSSPETPSVLSHPYLAHSGSETSRWDASYPAFPGRHSPMATGNMSLQPAIPEGEVLESPPLLESARQPSEMSIAGSSRRHSFGPRPLPSPNRSASALSTANNSTPSLNQRSPGLRPLPSPPGGGPLPPAYYL
jgi:hypothetical protein